MFIMNVHNFAKSQPYLGRHDADPDEDAVEASESSVASDDDLRKSRPLPVRLRAEADWGRVSNTLSVLFRLCTCMAAA